MEKIRNSKRLFGTDGIRGRFGTSPLDEDSLVKLGNSIAGEFVNSRILIASDTRESSEEIINFLASGIGESCKIYSAGVLTTPALSYETANGEFDLGIMVTASHNPFWDNGLKLFSSSGEKLDPLLEDSIEERFFNKPSAEAFKVELNTYEAYKYKEFICEKAFVTITPGFRVVLDCANGAAFSIAPEIYTRLGFDMVAINCEPDGRNINEGCGSINPEKLLKKVLTENAELGIAFDGDGDRVIFVDRNGNILDGDHTIGLLAEYFMENEPGFNGKVVGTVMSNLGLESFFESRNIELLRTNVGDKYVYEEMKKQESILGGEQSGHTILAGYQNTGDGILTSLFFIKALFFFSISASEVFNKIYKYPQVVVNIEVNRIKPIDQWKELQDLINDFNTSYKGEARILIRYSGTEPKIRVMVEADKKEIIDENLQNFCDLIRKEIGVMRPLDEAGN